MWSSPALLILPEHQILVGFMVYPLYYLSFDLRLSNTCNLIIESENNTKIENIVPEDLEKKHNDMGIPLAFTVGDLVLSSCV